MRIFLCVSYLFLIFNTHLYAQHVYIVLHGTWGSETTWYAPGGDFFDALESNAHKQSASVTPFRWSGKNSVEARNAAARNLAKLIDTYDASTTIIIIGHSHGGTVALLASDLIKNNKIALLYTLGTPINKAIYPNMTTINYCYNLFSFEDLVQPVFGMFDREHAPHERIANIRVVINGKEPDHSGLHDPLVATWLPYLHDIISNSAIALQEPGVIFFSCTTAPVYKWDNNRNDLVERDRRLSQLMLHAVRKPAKSHSPLSL
jgi:pimeloyl-ACP methyl ester carboxylesterase